MAMLRAYRVSIPNSEIKHGSFGSSHALYSVELDDGSPALKSVKKRYKNFYELHSKLKRGFSNLPELPPKKLFGNVEAIFVDRRRSALESYLQSLLSHEGVVCNSGELWAFLDADATTVLLARFLMASLTSDVNAIEQSLLLVLGVTETQKERVGAQKPMRAYLDLAPATVPKVQRLICRIIQAVIRENNPRKRFIKEGGLSVFIQLMASDDATVKESAATVLKDVAILEPSGFLSFVREEGLQNLTRFTVHTESTYVQDVCAVLVWTVTAIPEIETLFTQQGRGGLELLGGLLVCGSDTARVFAGLSAAYLVSKGSFFNKEVEKRALHTVSTLSGQLESSASLDDSLLSLLQRGSDLKRLGELISSNHNVHDAHRLTTWVMSELAYRKLVQDDAALDPLRQFVLEPLSKLVQSDDSCTRLYASRALLYFPWKSMNPTNQTYTSLKTRVKLAETLLEEITSNDEELGQLREEQETTVAVRTEIVRPRLDTLEWDPLSLERFLSLSKDLAQTRSELSILQLKIVHDLAVFSDNLNGNVMERGTLESSNEKYTNEIETLRQSYETLSTLENTKRELETELFKNGEDKLNLEKDIHKLDVKLTETSSKIMGIAKEGEELRRKWIDIEQLIADAPNRKRKLQEQKDTLEAKLLQLQETQRASEEKIRGFDETKSSHEKQITQLTLHAETAKEIYCNVENLKAMDNSAPEFVEMFSNALHLTNDLIKNTSPEAEPLLVTAADPNACSTLENGLLTHRDKIDMNRKELLQSLQKSNLQCSREKEKLQDILRDVQITQEDFKKIESELDYIRDPKRLEDESQRLQTETRRRSQWLETKNDDMSSIEKEKREVESKLEAKRAEIKQVDTDRRKVLEEIQILLLKLEDDKKSLQQRVLLQEEQLRNIRNEILTLRSAGRGLSDNQLSLKAHLLSEKDKRLSARLSIHSLKDDLTKLDQQLAAIDDDYKLEDIEAPSPTTPVSIASSSLS
eukprot:GILJ01005490.1.p1 GENE.GILJ01005490.1~~GILJ01005490.1.p1  ORF type:complete len:980 (-),score=210.32 GILJ01005490.1:31-2970(-)